MIDSFRVKLTLWNLAAFGLLLLAFSVGVYYLLFQSVNRQLESGLQSALEVTSLALHHEIVEHNGKDPGEASLRDVLNTMHQTSFPRQSIAVFEQSRLVAMKPGLEGLPAASMHPGQGAGRFRNEAVKGGNYRVGSIRVTVPSIGVTYDVVAAQSTESVDVELASFRNILWIAAPFGLLLAAVGGYFLALKNLAPIAALSDAVRRITSENLHERLEVPNPRDELGQLAGTFNQLLGRLDRAFEQQRRFMADASHELRTPLSVALTAAQVNLEAGAGTTTEEYRDALRVVAEQLHRLKRVVQDMFLLAKADSGVLEPRMEACYLDELIDECIRGAQIIGQRKRVAVGRTGPQGIEAPFVGDEGLLRQLVSNLLDNAIRHTDAGGSVQVALDRDAGAGTGGWYRITVSDNGSGIPEQDQPLIFDRFFRVNKARSRSESMSGGGAGLGLSIVKWIAELHGGSVALTSSSPRGTIFSVLLPCAGEDAAAPPVPAAIETTIS